MKTTAVSMMWVVKLLEGQPDRKAPAEQPTRRLHVKSRRLPGIVLVGAILLLALAVSILVTATS